MHISCRKLVDLDLGVSKSDPFVVAFIRNEKEIEWHCLGKTETMWNDLNPNFLKTFKINYFFEKNQFMRFEVYEFDDSESELIGYFECPVNRLLTANKSTINGDLFFDIDGKMSKLDRGKIIIRADSVAESNFEV